MTDAVEVKGLTALAQDQAKVGTRLVGAEAHRQQLAVVLDVLRPMLPLLCADVGPWLTFDGRSLGLVALAARLVDSDPVLRHGMSELLRVVKITDIGVSLADVRREELAFERTLGHIARRLAPRLSCVDVAEHPIGAELLVRVLCMSLSVPVRVGKRVETQAQSEEAVRRLDAGLDPEAESRLAYERRQATTLASLQQVIASGGALPVADKLRSQ